ncbi:MAG TPA: site-2 protease family protein [Longimicrobiales bacterium]|nr:site-2 protease family protein [Longimicrobiales bacterium]
MTKSRRAPITPMTGLRIGSVLGFEIRVDLSWFVIFFLVFWSLAEAVFPTEHPDLPRLTHLSMGLAGTLLFFASLLAHELSHAVVSRSKGIPVEGITLFIFGGMAWTSREPDTPRDELLIAGVGPVASLTIAALFAIVGRLSAAIDLGTPVSGVANYLAFINLALAIFNLMPGFPLDGGRVFRAIVWSVTGDRSKATRWAVLGGRSFGTALIVLGAIQALTISPVSGLWLIFIGWFLRNLAGSSLRQQVLHDLLNGYVAADLMSPQPEVVATRLPLSKLVEDHFMRLRYGSYPVVDGGQLVGMITLEEVKRIPASEWPGTAVVEVMTALPDCAVVAPRTSVEEALREMSRPTARGRALVVDGGQLVGIVSASDVARWIQRLQAMESLVGRTA